MVGRTRNKERWGVFLQGPSPPALVRVKVEELGVELFQLPSLGGSDVAARGACCAPGPEAGGASVDEVSHPPFRGVPRRQTHDAPGARPLQKLLRERQARLWGETSRGRRRKSAPFKSVSVPQCARSQR